MSNVSDDGVGIYLKVEMNFDGVFTKWPLTYLDGKKFVFTEHDFAGMNLAECKEFLARFMGDACEKIFYCIPKQPLQNGIRCIRDDGDYADFLCVAYTKGCEISIYIDHIGDELEDYFEDEGLVSEHTAEEDSSDEKDSCVEGVEEEVKDEVISKKNSREEASDSKGGFMGKDEFLEKLCVAAKKIEKGDLLDSSDEDEDHESADKVHSKFVETLHWKKQTPILGQRFENPAQLKHMLCNYGVTNGYQLCYQKNDKSRLLVKCCKGECSFRLWATWMSSERSFQIKSLKPNHSCSRNFRLGPLVTYKWIGSHYTKDILHKQKLSIRKLRYEVMKKFGIQVSVSQCRRAKQYALSLIEGTLVEHYAKLWSYAEELRRSNPGSTVKLDVLCMPDGKNHFSKFYVCFEGIKKGWIEGCRRIISLDGCFLKGICKGELLCALGRDANNGIFPIAWAVVCVENKENWKWFLELVIDDLNLATGHGISLMSDQHKGLIQAVKEVLPNAEHRQCAKHIAGNLRKRFSGLEYENLFWKASKGSTEAEYVEAMRELQKLNPQAHAFLMDKDPKTWSRAFFQTGRCCDSVENGMSESFNAIIVDARKKPIISMLEDIRVYMMDRLFRMNQNGLAWGDMICPNIRDILDILKKRQRHWQVFPSGMNQFEISCEGEAYAVDVERRTCSCRLWQLNGYGCVHSTAELGFLNRNVEDYVDRMFHSSMYMKSYGYRIGALNGSKMWPETTYIPPLPPISRRMPGRPVVKRKRDASEGVRIRVSKKGKRISCSICKHPGHNKKTCKQGQPPIKKMKVKKRKKDLAEIGESSNHALHDIPIQENIAETQESRVGVEVGEEGLVNLGAGRVKPRKRQSERILKKKLSINVAGVHGEGNTPEKPMDLE